MTKLAMISQPMRGKTAEEIEITRERAIAALKSHGYEVVDSYFKDEFVNDKMPEETVNKPLWFLSKSLEKMSLCEALYCCEGWSDARGCKIEHEVALAYGLEIIYPITADDTDIASLFE